MKTVLEVLGKEIYVSKGGMTIRVAHVVGFFVALILLSD